MAGAFVIPKGELPLQRTYERTYGPFAEADLADHVADGFTKDTVVDAVEVFVGTPSDDAGAVTLALVSVSAEQTLADAITATQNILGAAVNLKSGADGDVITPEIDDAWNIIPAGGRLGFNLTGTATNLAALLIKVRYSEIVAR